VTDEERAALVTNNMALAWLAANQFRHLPSFQDDVEDFVGCALIGMVKASKAFDPKRAQFSTCAMFYARTEIINHIRLQSKWHSKVERSAVSIEIFPDETTREGYTPDIDFSHLASRVGELLGCVPERWSGMVRDYYGIGVPKSSVDDIAKKHKVSKQRVRQLLVNALVRMQEYAQRNQLTYRDGEIVRAS